MKKNKKNYILSSIMFTILCIIITLFVSYIFMFNKINDSYSLKGKESVTLSYKDSYEEDGVNCVINDVDYCNIVKINNNVEEGKVGKYSISYTLDVDNIVTILYRTVNIVDTEAPIIADMESEIYLTVNEGYTLPKAYAYDDYDKDISDKVEIINNIDINNVGDYNVIYKVSDSSGNTSSKEIIVHVRNKFDHTYIVVSISNQTLKYYEYNNVVIETSVVTGKNNATKTGTYKIRNKVRNTYLKGADYVSFVQYWMAYDGNNFGIHDASWRSSFGGNIYKTNGSHGCINTPTNAMKQLYERVEVGTPVYIYK